MYCAISVIQAGICDSERKKMEKELIGLHQTVDVLYLDFIIYSEHKSSRNQILIISMIYCFSVD